MRRKTSGSRGVKADGNPRETGVRQASSLLRQQVAVGGQGQILDPLEIRQGADQRRQLRPEKGLTAGQANLANPQRGENPRQPGYFFEAEDLLAGKKFVALIRGHTERAAEVAAIRHRDPQIRHGTL